ncbi:MAG: M16 family metallopeptidase [Bryobacteraceae bacterium]
MFRAKSLCLLLAGVTAVHAQNLQEFEKKVTRFTLANGLSFLTVERHDAPVVSFHTHVSVGSLHDPAGRTGLAHMFEHMAFKGTPAIGSENWAEEQKALAAVTEAYDALEAERRKGLKADASRVSSLDTQLKAAIDRAGLYVKPNEFPRIIEENGGVGLNAATGLESTTYHYNLPANRIELWFLLESQRFLRPVFREFYKERDVVREERRQRVESSPQGKLQEALLTTAFAAHPYRQMPGGWASDIENLTVSDAQDFFRTHYVPGNITIGIVGDVDPREVRRLADKYFGPLPARPLPPLIRTVEPPQQGVKRIQVVSEAQPLLMIAYKRTDQLHPDDIVFDVISLILSSGRTGTLYKLLVRDRKTALAAVAAPTFPGGRYPCLFAFLIAPTPGHTLDENEKLFEQVLRELKDKPVDDATMRRVKIKARASLLRRLDGNEGLAQLMTLFHTSYGDWRRMFTVLDDLDRVTAADVERVAKKYFVDTGKTVAMLGPDFGGKQ